jgi:hypothetical protein
MNLRAIFRLTKLSNRYSTQYLQKYNRRHSLRHPPRHMPLITHIRPENAPTQKSLLRKLKGSEVLPAFRGSRGRRPQYSGERNAV